MNALIIDSTWGLGENITSLHARNSKVLSAYMNCPLIGSKEVPEELERKFDSIIFVHASAYTNVAAFAKLMDLNKESKFFYVKNEYNLGEAVILWGACKDHGLKFQVIANHTREASTNRFKNTCDVWNILNLNTLIYGKFNKPSLLSKFTKKTSDQKKIVYYGACRRDRVKYFQKYFKSKIVVSTSDRNREFYNQVCPEAYYINRLNWSGKGLSLANFQASLYIEDEHTHDNYNFLANRFYESLNYGVPCFFDKSTEKSIKLSGYPINEWYIVDSSEELMDKINTKDWADYGFDILRQKASEEKENVLKTISDIVKG